MCDLLRSLQGELEVFRRRRLPRLNGLGAGHSVKRVVDLDAVQTGRIILKKLLVREALGIENRPPFFIAETRSTEPDPRHLGIIAQHASESRVNIGQKK